MPTAWTQTSSTLWRRATPISGSESSTTKSISTLSTPATNSANPRSQRSTKVIATLQYWPPSWSWWTLHCRRARGRFYNPAYRVRLWCRYTYKWMWERAWSLGPTPLSISGCIAIAMYSFTRPRQQHLPQWRARAVDIPGEVLKQTRSKSSNDWRLDCELPRTIQIKFTHSPCILRIVDTEM